MDDIAATRQKTLTITSSTAAANLIAPISGESGIEPAYIDLNYLVLANSSATPSLVTLSDGTNNYYFVVGANSTVKAIGDGINLIPASTPNTAWTLQCAASIASLYATALYSLRT